MKAYKGFDKSMKCRGFQFEEGKTYHEDSAELCKSGFHACTSPLDVFKYYRPGVSVYRKVELDEVSNEQRGDSKVCAKTIKIGAELGVLGLVRAHVEWVKKEVANSPVSSGYEGNAVSSGDRGNAVSSGDRGNAVSSGYEGNAVSSGYRGNAVSSGDEGNAVSSGYRGNAVSSGDRGNAVTTGKAGTALTTGRSGKVKGSIGCAIFAVERGDWDGETCPILSVSAAIVDGEKIKVDTWYTLKNGEFVEVENE